MATGRLLDGKSYAGRPYVRLDGRDFAQAATLGRWSLLYKIRFLGAIVVSVAISSGMCADVRSVSTSPQRTGLSVSAVPKGKRTKDDMGKVLGSVKSVKVVGAKGFAERKFKLKGQKGAVDKTLSDMILAELGAEGDKTVADVLNALAGTRKRLANEGFVLVRLSHARGEYYDSSTKELLVLVDDGIFGEMTVAFDDKCGDQDRKRAGKLIGKYRSYKGSTFDLNVLRAFLQDADKESLVLDVEISPLGWNPKTSAPETGDSLTA